MQYDPIILSDEDKAESGMIFCGDYAAVCKDSLMLDGMSAEEADAAVEGLRAKYQRQPKRQARVFLVKFATEGGFEYYGLFSANGPEDEDVKFKQLKQNKNFGGLVSGHFTGYYVDASKVAAYLYDINPDKYDPKHDRDICYFFRSDKGQGAVKEFFKIEAKAYHNALQQTRQLQQAERTIEEDKREKRAAELAA